VLSTLVHGEFELGVGVIVGSAIFNILVIPGVSGLVGGRLEPHGTLVYKDAQFYITSLAVLLLTFSLAVIYRPVEGAALTGELSRTLALIPVALYGLYLFLQQQDAAEYRPATRQSECDPRQEWRRLVLSLAMILMGVEALLWAVIGLGDAFGTPSFLWGLYLASLIWFVFIFGAIWRAAGIYPGRRLWPLLARLGVLVGILRMSVEAWMIANLPAVAQHFTARWV